ncbi:similar to Saccharomyces cerevisiae YDR081C PDC2 Transcription factor required for the synthesis of the glycolytic enzyme pyruvate decarboxylase [Maudiozyma saulgeensis]|uniref:Similar to Saccharomyces cerevisiae YDR081C PDC2 Transcription factor required for the synthesis of the glycolytic enzyme pyruvate decarboxylase n=1 Tax=Maudiozyma saulgeensis TaxID=1789683 RepID=A0A1X7R8C3_9SACH|nr:similar to Saccharomyces cerevisiae YDR081C PDC2 Transcription factor required for the synthesis of the glycolytic enzyme pyruvate decarboxylase [Kazachstania saulgeensis]
MLSVEQRYNICLMAETHPKWTQQELARWAYETFQLPKIPSQGTISRILTKKSTYMNTKEHEKDVNRIRKPNNLLVRRILQEWINQSLWNGIPITSPIIQETAHAVWQRIPSKYREGNGSFTYKWISNFLAKMDVNVSILDEEMPKIPKIWTFEERSYLKEYFSKLPATDVFTLDETFLAYNLPLDYAQYEISSIQRKVEVATVMLCANLDGTEKLKPLVVGKYENYKSFRNYFPNEPLSSLNQSSLGDKMAKKFDISYQSNTKSWLTSNLFHDWLVRWDKRLVAYNRKIWIVLDDSCSHRIINLHLHNITLIYTSATSKFLPLNWGVLDEFKTRYRIQQYNALIELQNKYEEKTKHPYFISFEQSELTMSNAFKFIKNAWDEIPLDTIKANWKSSGIIPSNLIHLNENISMAFKKNEALEAELDNLCHKYRCVKQWEYDMLLDLNMENKSANFLSMEELVESSIIENMEPGDDTITKMTGNEQIKENDSDDDGLLDLPGEENLNELSTINNKPQRSNSMADFNFARFADNITKSNGFLPNNTQNDDTTNILTNPALVDTSMDQNLQKFLNEPYLQDIQNNYFNVSNLIDRPNLFLPETESTIPDIGIDLPQNDYLTNVFGNTMSPTTTSPNTNSTLPINTNVINTANTNFDRSPMTNIGSVGNINTSTSGMNNSPLNMSVNSVQSFDVPDLNRILHENQDNTTNDPILDTHSTVTSNGLSPTPSRNIVINSRQTNIEVAKALYTVILHSDGTDLNISKSGQSELRATYRSLLKQIRKTKPQNNKIKKMINESALDNILNQSNQNINLENSSNFL